MSASRAESSFGSYSVVEASCGQIVVELVSSILLCKTELQKSRDMALLNCGIFVVILDVTKVSSEVHSGHFLVSYMLELL